MHAKTIAETLKISQERAVLVEAYLRLQYGTIGQLSRVDIVREYRSGGISATIDADLPAALQLAKSYGLPTLATEA